MLDSSTFNHDLLAFLRDSPTPYHAVQAMVRRLEAAGFQALNEADDWQLAAQGSYYVVRHGSSIIAFHLNGESQLDNGFRMVGAHTDSPCLKVKPNPELNSKGYFQLGVEVYGGALLAPWFDRDLSLAGKVNYITPQGQMQSALIDFKRPIASIPSLAIHLDREANNSRSINPQKDIPPVLMMAEKDEVDFRQWLLTQLLAEQPQAAVEKILDFDLSFYDTQPAALVGLNNEFIAAARLDNLLSCYIGLQALINSVNEPSAQNSLLVCNDHEEVGSQSATGAQGPMLKSVLSRIIGQEADFVRCMERSMMISADNAHGVHPNFADRHDANHGPLLNSGPVIKSNANQRYATSSDTSSLFRRWCEQVGQPVQSFAVRTDMACGSTIGPIAASELGVKTLDVGVPSFAMHSIRELAGSLDSYGLYNVLLAFHGAKNVAVTAC